MGIELELLFDQLPPVRTTTKAAEDDGDDGCATPTSAANVLRAPPTCPPAPRKPRPAQATKRKLQRKRYCCCCCCRGRRRCTAGPRGVLRGQQAQPRWVIAVPHDVLAAVFVARRPASTTGASPCVPTAGKKIRVHVVG